MSWDEISQSVSDVQNRQSAGIQIILIAVDNMPALSACRQDGTTPVQPVKARASEAPRETLMLIPRQLTNDAEIKEP